MTATATNSGQPSPGGGPAAKSMKSKYLASKDKTPQIQGDLGYDSDEEREGAHRMFIEDIQGLRKFFIESIEEQIKKQEEMILSFHTERDFFLQSAQKGKSNL